MTAPVQLTLGRLTQQRTRRAFDAGFEYRAAMSKHVLGIGGLFYRSKDPKALAAWYGEHFGIPYGAEGGVWQQESGATVVSPFKADTDYFANDEQQFMLNLRVRDIDGFAEELRAKGVRIDEKRENESYGRFAWVYDPEGRKIELWEAPEP